VLKANGLEPRSGPTYVGPDLGSSLFATVLLDQGTQFSLLLHSI